MPLSISVKSEDWRVSANGIAKVTSCDSVTYQIELSVKLEFTSASEAKDLFNDHLDSLQCMSIEALRDYLIIITE